MPAQKARKKPVEIECWQWDGSTAGAHEIVAWILRNGGNAQIQSGWPFQGPDTIGIETLEGTMKAAKDDVIIKGVQGEFYPCKPDIFEATYDKVESDG